MRSSPLGRIGKAIVLWAAVAVAGAVTLWQLPHVARSVHSDIVNGSSLTPQQRALVPAESVGLTHREIFVAAAKALPRDAIYYIAVGRGVPGETPRSLGWVPPFAQYWLLPRRRTDDLGAAGWILSYGGDLRALGPRYRRVITLGPHIAVAEVRR